MARIVKDENGQFVAIMDKDGSRVPVAPSTVEKASFLPGPQPSSVARPASDPTNPADPFIVRNEQGVSDSERFILKNLANPQDVPRHLADWGYDVKPWGDHSGKIQYAVRPRGKKGVWKVLDPEGYDPQDLLDHFGDLGVGVAQGLGAAGGAFVGAAGGPAGVVAGEVAGSAAGSAAGEAARQGAGSAIGLEGNTDVSAIKSAAVVGGAIPVAAKLAAPLLRPVGQALAYGFERAGVNVRYAAARVAGVKALPGMSLKEAAEIVQNNAGKKVVGLADQAKAVYRLVGDPKTGLLNESWPEAAAVNDALSAANEKGAKMDFNPILENLEAMGGRAEEGARVPSIAEEEAQFAGAQKPLGPLPERAGKFWNRVSQKFEETAAEGAPQGPTGPGSPGFADFDREFRQGFKGKGLEDIPKSPPGSLKSDRFTAGGPTQAMPEFAGKTTPMAGATRELPFGATPDQKREAIAGFEKEFGAPGATAEPTPVEPTKEAAAAEFRAPGTRNQVSTLINFLHDRITKAGFRLNEVPLDLAHFLKREIQFVAKQGGMYAGQEVAAPFARAAGDAAYAVRQGIVEAMPDELRSGFVQNMTAFEAKTKLKNSIFSAFKSPADVESFLREVYGKSNASAARYLQGLEEHFGVSLTPDVKAGTAAEMMDHPNPGFELARRHPFVAAGALFRPEAGALILGGPAALPGIAKGLGAASRGVAAGTELASEAASRAANSPAAKAAAVAALHARIKDSTGKGIASESQATQATRGRRVTKLF